MRELEFSAPSTVGRRLSRVKEVSHQEIYSEISREALRYMKKALERRFLDVQEALLSCERYSRSEEREGYRHGFYSRSWTTRLGKIEALKVPRIRGRGGVVSALIRRYQRRESVVDEVLLDSFLHGLSTREACRVLQKLNGVRVSATTVSRLFSGMDSEVRAFHRRRLAKRYEYLIVDGIEIALFIGTAVKRHVLCALGITESGTLELLGFLLAPSESEASWLALLGDLERRGLKPQDLKLITADSAGGIWAAVERVYPGVKTQSCTFHKMSNATEKLTRRTHRARFSRQMAEIYNAPSAQSASKRLREFSSRWKKAEPRAVRALCEGFEKTLGFYDVPRKDWQRVRTTNLLERFFEEVRRRLKPMRVLPNISSAQRNFYARLALFNAKQRKEHPVKIIKFPQHS